MTRITNDHRERILRDVLNYRFAESYTLLQAEYAQLAQGVYETVYSATDRAKMEALPDGWLHKVTSIRVQFGERYADLPYSGSINGVSSYPSINTEINTTYRRVPARDLHGVMRVFETGENLAEVYAALAVASADLRNKTHQAESLASVVLDRATTVPKLLVAWPEVKPFLAFLDVPKPKLPALPIDQVNSLLDLPVDKAA